MFSLLLIRKNTFGYDTTKISKYSENLNRGVVAVRAGEGKSFISWRYLITDDDDISFNVYRTDEKGNTLKLNSDPITKVTHFYDTNHNKTKSFRYFVGSIINNIEVENSTYFELQANLANVPCIRIPIRNGTRFRTVWVGDLNGDGNLDFVLARDADEIQTVEAYLHNGTYLWTLNLGPNSINKYNIEPGSTAVNVGQIDGINIYDLDGDGKSEVYIRIANNFTFGDGYVFTHDNDVDQWIACVDGMTGKLLQKAKIPNFFPEYGPVGTLFGVGWLSLEKPSLIVAYKNRDDKKRFYNYVSTFSFTNNVFKLDWNWTDSFEPNIDYPEGHHFRIADVDFDGIDEIHQIGYVLNGNGTLRFNLGEQKIIHGDRFYVAKYNKEDTTMSGYGIQQNNPDLIDEYFYNASTGEMKWIHYGSEVHDVGRGNAGDFDPTVPGLEVFSFQGIYNAKTNKKVADNVNNSLWPSNNVFWDGTLIPACYDRGYLNKWNYKTQRADRLFSAYKEFYNKYGQYTLEDSGGHYPMFHGDILGDWREEFILAASNYSELVIFTTPVDTDIKMTTLWHDPGMRASMTLNGYKQSHMPLEYIGAETNLTENRRHLKEYHKLRAEKIHDNSKDNKSSKTAAIVVPIVIVIIILISIAAFFVWKIYKNRKQNGDGMVETTIMV